METLKEMLESSKYQTVAPNFDRILGHYPEGELIDGVILQQENPEDSDAWARLFEKTEIDGIQRNHLGEILITARLYVFGERQESLATYIHSPTIQNEIRHCEPGFADVACGSCIVNIDADWWLVYRWWPSDLTDNEFDSWMDGEISEDEFYEKHDQIHNECIADGGTSFSTTE